MFTASSQSKSKEGSIKKTKAQSAIEAAVFDSIQRTLSLLWDRIKDVEFISEREAAEHIQTETKVG